jgi:hypothetical protein
MGDTYNRIASYRSAVLLDRAWAILRFAALLTLYSGRSGRCSRLEREKQRSGVKISSYIATYVESSTRLMLHSALSKLYSVHSGELSLRHVTSALDKFKNI